MIGTTRLTGPDGEDLILLFDHAGMVVAEDAADKPFDQVVNGAVAGRLGHQAALLLGGLARHHPTFTLAHVHSILAAAREAGTMIGVLEALIKAIEAAMPKRTKADPPKAPESGTGTASSEPGLKKVSTRKASGGTRRASSPRR